jgi:hypothetical protein
VRWPDGTRTSVAVAAVDGQLTIEQGAARGAGK